IATAQSVSYPRGSSPTTPELDTLSSEFIKELWEGSKGGSPFVSEIQDKPIPINFRLHSLESYDCSSDPAEHIAAFYTQMTLYDIVDTLMSCAFPTTLRGLARMWYSWLMPSSISSFNQLAMEFELNFLASTQLRPTAASFLGLSQGSEESLPKFVGCFATEI
ncbi:hypothetical protein B296_00028187, partial [Ensete ventricosum]